MYAKTYIYIVFDLDSYQDVMYYRYNGNDLLIKHRFLAEADKSDIDSQADNADSINVVVA
jgi:hypothetical protein